MRLPIRRGRTRRMTSSVEGLTTLEDTTRAGPWLVADEVGDLDCQMGRGQDDNLLLSVLFSDGFMERSASSHGRLGLDALVNSHCIRRQVLWVAIYRC